MITLSQKLEKIAQKYELDISDKPDSQDICFVTSSSYRDLVKNLNPTVNKKGIIYDIDKNILGTHDGISNFTIGQRKVLALVVLKKPYM